MPILLRTVGLRYYREAPGRLALITLGIASGVALVAALGIVNRTVLLNLGRHPKPANDRHLKTGQ